MNFSKILGWFFVFLIAFFCAIIIAWSEIFFGEQICDSGFENFWEEVTEKKLSEEEKGVIEELQATLWLKFDDSLPKCQKLLIENCGNDGKIQHQIYNSLTSCFYNPAKPENFNSEICVGTLLLSKKIGIDIEDKVKELDSNINSEEYKDQLFKLSIQVNTHKNYIKIKECKRQIMKLENSCVRDINPIPLKKQETGTLRACTGSETIVYGIKFFTFNLIRAAIRAF